MKAKYSAAKEIEELRNFQFHNLKDEINETESENQKHNPSNYNLSKEV